MLIVLLYLQDRVTKMVVYRYQCNMCDRDYASISSLNRHFSARHTNNELTCKLCGYSTGYQSAMKSHIDKSVCLKRGYMSLVVRSIEPKKKNVGILVPRRILKKKQMSVIVEQVSSDTDNIQLCSETGKLPLNRSAHFPKPISKLTNGGGYGIENMVETDLICSSPKSNRRSNRWSEVLDEYVRDDDTLVDLDLDVSVKLFVIPIL